MFLGHFAVSFAAKKIAPKASLGTLFLAAQFLDLLWPTFLLLGLESVRVAPGITPVTQLDFVSYPFSHSLLMAIGWSVIFGHVYYVIRRNGREAIVLGFAVLSHWILDYITHRPDLPLTPAATTRVGLGLWYSLPATLVVELGMFLAACILYARTRRPIDRTGRYAFYGLIAFLTIAYFAAIFAPPPPDVKALAWGAQSVWLLVVWGYWIDRHRKSHEGTTTRS